VARRLQSTWGIFFVLKPCFGELAFPELRREVLLAACLAVHAVGIVVVRMTEGAKRRTNAKFNKLLGCLGYMSFAGVVWSRQSGRLAAAAIKNGSALGAGGGGGGGGAEKEAKASLERPCKRLANPHFPPSLAR
jgi:hypothetical protein